MPCGCSGSNQASPRRSAQKAPTPPRPGGPGQPGFTWDGPKKRAVDSGSTKK